MKYQYTQTNRAVRVGIVCSRRVSKACIILDTRVLIIYTRIERLRYTYVKRLLPMGLFENTNHTDTFDSSYAYRFNIIQVPCRYPYTAVYSAPYIIRLIRAARDTFRPAEYIYIYYRIFLRLRKT